MKIIPTIIERFDGSISLITSRSIKKDVQTLDLAEYLIAQDGNHCIRHLHPAGIRRDHAKNLRTY